jgi:hypothetical protein
VAGFSRSTVSLAEIGRQSQARDFWEACDKALDTGGVLTAGADQIGKVRDAEQRAAALAAQEAREARALAALTAAQRHSGVSAGVTGVQACPHCGGEVTVLTTLMGARPNFRDLGRRASPGPGRISMEIVSYWLRVRQRNGDFRSDQLERAALATSGLGIFSIRWPPILIVSLVSVPM